MIRREGIAENYSVRANYWLSDSLSEIPWLSSSQRKADGFSIVLFGIPRR